MTAPRFTPSQQERQARAEAELRQDAARFRALLANATTVVLAAPSRRAHLLSMPGLEDVFRRQLLEALDELVAAAPILEPEPQG